MGQRHSGGKAVRTIDALVLALFVLLIFVTPLSFGSVQPVSVFAIELTAISIFVLWCIKLLFCSETQEFRNTHREWKLQRKALPFFQRHSWLASSLGFLTLGKWPKRNMAGTLVSNENQQDNFPYYSLIGFPVRKTGLEPLGLLFLAVMAIQILPLPAGFISLMSPATGNLYETAAQFAGTHLRFFSISLDRFSTVSKLIEYSAYFLVFLAVVNSVQTRKAYWLILCAIFASASFQAVYGLFELLSGHQQIFSYHKKFGLDAATGTFINRNHYAAYLEVSLPLLLALVMGRLSTLKAFSGRLIVRIGHALETRGSQLLLLVFLITLVAVALLLSLSRSGISFALVALFTFLLLYWRKKEELSGKTYLILGACGSLALAVWIGLNPLLLRFTQISENWLNEGSRWNVWQDTFKIFRNFPLFGTGAGTFEQIFPMYRSVPYELVYRQAHNDYLQLLSELGIATLFLVIAVFIVMVQRLRKISGRELSRQRVVQIGAFCSLLSIALHSLTDFSLQIPAIAVLASIVAGLFFANDHLENQKS